LTFKCAWKMAGLILACPTSGKYCHTSYRLRRRGVEGKQGKNRSPLTVLLILICLGYQGSRPLSALTHLEKWKVVDSACEYLYRMRPIAEWTAYQDGRRHKLPRDFLFEALPAIEAFRLRWPGLTTGCRALKRAFVNKAPLQEWLQSGVSPQVAFTRAQLLTVGVSAIMHRIGSPSPGRDFFLLAGVSTGRYCIGRHGGPVSHTAAASARRTSTISTRRLESLFGSSRPTRIVFRFGSPDSNRCSVRVARLESLFGSGRPTRIVFRFGPPDSIRLSVRVARLESLRSPDASVVCWL
jgi:hypothetical protein